MNMYGIDEQKLNAALEDEMVEDIWETLSIDEKESLLKRCAKRYIEAGYPTAEAMVARVVHKTYGY